MNLEIVPYTRDLIPRVKDFNDRLHAVYPHWSFSQTHASQWLPRVDGRSIFQDFFLAVDDGGMVRGAFVLKSQLFHIKGQIKSVANYQLPLSEGICDPVYSGVGSHILLDALERQPLLFCLGMGGMSEPLPRMLDAMGWSMCTVPFFFKVNSPSHFLRRIDFLRKRRHLRLALDALAFSGLGPVLLKGLHAILTRRPDGLEKLSSEEVPVFGAWADSLWQQCKSLYDVCAVRDAAVLNILYPEDKRRFIKLKVSRGSKVLGWAVLLDTQMTQHKYFGRMRVGSIIDCFASTENAADVIYMAARYLEKRGVDILVSNQLHFSWGEALRRSGFVRGPSNFLFSASKDLASMFEPVDKERINIHMNRGDGDGPINL